MARSRKLTAEAEEVQMDEAAKHLKASPLLEIVSPPPGFVVDRALCSAYSAQSAVLAAMLMAMIRQGPPDGHGSSTALARALHQLKGRVTFLVQHGRMVGPRNRNPIVHLLDRFVVNVDYDEKHHSWHPKICLLRFSRSAHGSETEVLWRLWLGSRNFTRSDCWDLALTISSEPAQGKGAEIRGIGELARKLADQAHKGEVWKTLVKEISSVRWQVPAGLCVEEIALQLQAGTGRTLAPLPPTFKAAIVCSPFLDTWGIGNLCAGVGPGSPRPQLISTDRCLEELSSKARNELAKYSLHSLDPSFQDDLPEESDEQDSGDAEPQSRGLHAKFIWTECGKRGELRLGSTNLTERGWTKNAEVMATVAMTLPGGMAVQQLRAGIIAFRNQCLERELTELAFEEDPEDATKEKLEALRKELAHTLRASQRLEQDDTVSIATLNPPRLPPEVILKVGRISESLVSWPSGSSGVVLPAGPRHENGDLLQLELSLGSTRMAWLQSAPFNPPLDADVRDLPLIRQYLGFSGILDWLNDILSRGGNGGGSRIRWDKVPRNEGSASKLAIPGIESVLAGWVRDRTSLNEARLVVGLARASLTGSNTDEESAKRLNAFLLSWDAIDEELSSG